MLSYLAEIEAEYARIGDSSDRLEQLAACRELLQPVTAIADTRILRLDLSEIRQHFFRARTVFAL